MKKTGFLLMELAIMIALLGLFSVIMLQAYRTTLREHQRALQKLRALMSLSSYIHAWQSHQEVKMCDKNFTLTHEIIKTTPQGRTKLMRCTVSWNNEDKHCESLTLEAGMLT
ncbi:MAG: hypothetical protein WA432_03185 [Candidatus Babeliaceae bacterium]